jgi:PAS domain S-box-containing protein
VPSRVDRFLDERHQIGRHGADVFGRQDRCAANDAGNVPFDARQHASENVVNFAGQCGTLLFAHRIERRCQLPNLLTRKPQVNRHVVARERAMCARGAFTPARIAVLKVLASQAAMTLENARLYRDLAEREAKIRRLVDANIVGIFIGDLEGRMLEANDAFLRIVGYDRDDLLAERLRWTDLTPSEWLEHHRREWVPELKVTGTLQPYEKEYFRKDGSRVPVLVGVAMLEERGTQGIAFVLDLSERKRVEAEARQMQLELAHANRVTSIGHLAASIGHEIKQPIAGITLNASTGLRWLAHDPPDMSELRQAFDRIVRDAKRAGEVIKRIHGLVKKAPTCNEILQINEAIREVMALTSSEANRNGVSVRLQLAEDLPLIQGDRVQLQQVMLNLVINVIDAMSAVDVGPRELTISTAMNEPGAALVTVCDSGPGVAPEHIERLFEPFYTTKATGLGMGLSICRSIIEAHGGRLWASANVPRGAIFEFMVPSIQMFQRKRASYSAPQGIAHRRPRPSVNGHVMSLRPRCVRCSGRIHARSTPTYPAIPTRRICRGRSADSSEEQRCVGRER